MDKKGLLDEWLDEYNNLAHAHAETFDIGRGMNKEQSDAYWLGIQFGRDYVRDLVIKIISLV